MARPQKEGLDYFPHDTDAVNDEKIEALRALYGNDGYAFFFILLERIYRSNSTEIDVSDAETRQILANKVAVSMEKFDQMLITALKWQCFDRDIYAQRGVLTSSGIKKRAGVVLEKRVRARGNVEVKVVDAETTQKPVRNSEITPQSKVKKRKEKDSKENKLSYAESVTMTEDEHRKLVEEYGEQGTKRMIEILDNYKGSSGKKYKSDYKAILNWVVKRWTEEQPKSKQGKPKPVFEQSSPNTYDEDAAILRRIKASGLVDEGEEEEV